MWETLEYPQEVFLRSTAGLCSKNSDVKISLHLHNKGKLLALTERAFLHTNIFLHLVSQTWKCSKVYHL